MDNNKIMFNIDLEYSKVGDKIYLINTSLEQVYTFENVAFEIIDYIIDKKECYFHQLIHHIKGAYQLNKLANSEITDFILELKNENIIKLS